ncbi:MAG TPA: hypothetical protein VEU08_21630, partial [Vicinamibacterales bacterium]|nr:hypothetical protein [Vicinamibacterales bacterium]
SEAPQTPAPPLVRAQLLAAGDEASRRQAVALLDEYLQDAPPGFAGWTIPVEPFLSELQSDQQFAAVLMRLRARAE